MWWLPSVLYVSSAHLWVPGKHRWYLLWFCILAHKYSPNAAWKHKNWWGWVGWLNRPTYQAGYLVILRGLQNAYSWAEHGDTYNYWTCECKAGGSLIPGHPELRRKFKDRLGNIRKPCLKKEAKSPKTNNAKLVTLPGSRLGVECFSSMMGSVLTVVSANKQENECLNKQKGCKHY